MAAKINSRSKGQAGERQVADLLNAAMHRATGDWGDWHRNWQEQSHHGGCDLVSPSISWMSVEVKFYKTLTEGSIRTWWAQTLDQARPHELPVLFYKANQVAWRVRTYGSPCWHECSMVVDLNVGDFLRWFESFLTSRIEASKGGAQ